MTECKAGETALNCFVHSMALTFIATSTRLEKLSHYLVQVQHANARMKASPMSRKYETMDYRGYEFDYQTYLTQFLEEPRKNGFDGNLISAPLEDVGKKKLDEKKNRKSWKSSLFSWLRTDNRNGTTISKPGRGHFSSPLDGTGGGITGGLWARRLTLGPLICLFNLTRRVEDEVPYMSLGQLNNPQDVQSYGPVYLVS